MLPRDPKKGIGDELIKIQSNTHPSRDSHSLEGIDFGPASQTSAINSQTTCNILNQIFVLIIDTLSSCARYLNNGC